VEDVPAPASEAAAPPSPGQAAPVARPPGRPVRTRPPELAGRAEASLSSLSSLRSDAASPGRQGPEAAGGGGAGVEPSPADPPVPPQPARRPAGGGFAPTGDTGVSASARVGARGPDARGAPPPASAAAAEAPLVPAPASAALSADDVRAALQELLGTHIAPMLAAQRATHVEVVRQAHKTRAELLDRIQAQDEQIAALRQSVEELQTALGAATRAY